MAPLLPLLYIEGKQVRRRVPRLPEAIQPEGKHGNGFKYGLNVLLLGESTLAGVGVQTHRQGFAGSFAEALSRLLHTAIYWQVHAQSGCTIRQLRQTVVPQTGTFKPDLIVIGMGANDAFRLCSPLTWRKEMTLLIEQLQATCGHCPIVLLNTPPIHLFPAFPPLIRWSVGSLARLFDRELQYMSATTQGLFHRAEALSIAQWQNRSGYSLSVNDLFSDGVHPSAVGYATWAQQTVEFISENTALMVLLRQKIQEKH